MTALAYAEGTAGNRERLLRRLRKEAFDGLYGGSPWFVKYGLDGKPALGYDLPRPIRDELGYGLAFLVFAIVSRADSETREGDTPQDVFDRRRRACDEAWRKGRGRIWKVANEYEGGGRLDAVRFTLLEARGEKKWIWLCSSHGDPAKGHRDWQGRYYYDSEAPEDVRKWAESQGMKPYQWVLWAPVYMVTRPNCRHYLASVTAEYAKSHGAESAIRELGLWHDIGERGDRQTLPPLTDRDIAREEYSSRLEMHTREYQAHPTAELEALVNKDRLLLSLL